MKSGAILLQRTEEGNDEDKTETDLNHNPNSVDNKKDLARKFFVWFFLGEGDVDGILSSSVIFTDLTGYSLRSGKFVGKNALINGNNHFRTSVRCEQVWVEKMISEGEHVSCSWSVNGFAASSPPSSSTPSPYPLTDQAPSEKSQLSPEARPSASSHSFTRPFTFVGTTFFTMQNNQITSISNMSFGKNTVKEAVTFDPFTSKSDPDLSRGVDSQINPSNESKSESSNTQEDGESASQSKAGKKKSLIEDANKFSSTLPMNVRRDLIWDEKYTQLIEFKRKYGHCNVTREGKHGKLGNWVHAMRAKRRRGKLSTERTDRLTKLGFEWDRSYYQKKKPKNPTIYSEEENNNEKDEEQSGEEEDLDNFDGNNKELCVLSPPGDIIPQPKSVRAKTHINFGIQTRSRTGRVSSSWSLSLLNNPDEDLDERISIPSEDEPTSDDSDEEVITSTPREQVLSPERTAKIEATACELSKQQTEKNKHEEVESEREHEDDEESPSKAEQHRPSQTITTARQYPTRVSSRRVQKRTRDEYESDFEDLRDVVIDDEDEAQSSDDSHSQVSRKKRNNRMKLRSAFRRAEQGEKHSNQQPSGIHHILDAIEEQEQLGERPLTAMRKRRR